MKILLLCHDLPTRLRLAHAWLAAGATDFAAHSFVDRRAVRRLELAG